MDESRIDEPGGQGEGVAAEPQEAQRSLAGVLAGDLNTVVTTAVSAVVGAAAVKKALGREPDAKVTKEDEGPAPEADTPA